MIPVNYGEGNFYCSNCDLRFGTLPDAKGNIYCPFCKKSIDGKLEGIVQLNHVTFQCRRCNLKFSAVPKDGQSVKCPVCPVDQSIKGGK